MQSSCPLFFQQQKISHLCFIQNIGSKVQTLHTSATIQKFCSFTPRQAVISLFSCLAAFLISTPNAQFWQNNFAGKCQIETNESMEKNYQLRIPNPKKCFTEPNLFKIRASKMTLLIQIFLIIPPNQQSLT